MQKCKSCGKEVADTAKSCPGCGAKVKKPIYKRIWFWVIIVFIVIGLASGGSGESSESSSSNNNEKTPTTKKEDLVLEDGHTGSPDEYLLLRKSYGFTVSKVYIILAILELSPIGVLKYLGCVCSIIVGNKPE